jgi:hypothetical protein
MIKEDIVQPWNGLMDELNEKLSYINHNDGFHIYTSNLRKTPFPDLKQEIIFPIDEEVISIGKEWFQDNHAKEIQIIEKYYGCSGKILFGVISEYC